jgi:hypothetical protein
MVDGMLDKDELDHAVHAFQHVPVQQLGAVPFDSSAFPICPVPPEEKARKNLCTQKYDCFFIVNPQCRT